MSKLPKSYVNFQLVNELEDLSGLYLAVDHKGYVWSVHLELLFVRVHTGLRGVIGLIVLSLEECAGLDLDDVLDEQGDDGAELVDTLPKPQDNGLLEEGQHGLQDLQIVDAQITLL